jgi:hypothetical protein
MNRPHLAVSIQAYGFTERPWEGHQGQALLSAPDRVLVLAPLPKVIEAGEPFDVLVIPLPLDNGRIERIAPVTVEFATVRLGLGPTTLVEVTLDRESRHEPNVVPMGCDHITDPNGDVWAAMTHAGGIVPGQADVLTDELLREVARVEREQHCPGLSPTALPGDEIINCKPPIIRCKP